MTVALPKHRSLVDESDLVSYFKNGVHVMGIDHSGHIELLRQVADESVDKDGSIWVQT